MPLYCSRYMLIRYTGKAKARAAGVSKPAPSRHPKKAAGTVFRCVFVINGDIMLSQVLEYGDLTSFLTLNLVTRV